MRTLEIVVVASVDGELCGTGCRFYRNPLCTAFPAPDNPNGYLLHEVSDESGGYRTLRCAPCLAAENQARVTDT